MWLFTNPFLDDVCVQTNYKGDKYTHIYGSSFYLPVLIRLSPLPVTICSVVGDVNEHDAPSPNLVTSLKNFRQPSLVLLTVTGQLNTTSMAFPVKLNQNVTQGWTPQKNHENSLLNEYITQNF